MASSQFGVSNPQKNKEEHLQNALPTAKRSNLKLKDRLDILLGRQPKIRRTVSSFEELCPEWSKHMNYKITPIEKAAIGTTYACAVAEAWDWSLRYSLVIPFLPVGCLKCHLIGSEFSSILHKESIDYDKLEQNRAKLVKHWNDKHGRPTSN